MPRLTADQWADVRAERETGTSFGDLAERHGVSKAAIIKRAKAEGWSDGADIAEAVRRKVTEKVTGVVTTGDPKKKAAALDAAADRVAEVVRRHQDEPSGARERVYAGLKAHKQATTKVDKALAFEDLKAAKIAAEALAIIQAMERKAFGLETHAEQEIVITNPRNARASKRED